MSRTVCLILFVVLSAVAGFFYYSNTRQASALVAAQDLKVGMQIQDVDIAIREVNPSSVSNEVFQTPSQVVGQFVTYPVLKGQFLGARQVSPSKNADLLGSGLNVPSGYRIVGLPITPAAAVGGALKPGDHVDVIAVPSEKGAPAVDAGPRTETLGRNVLVVGLRTDQGTPFERNDLTTGAVGAKPGSILLAIPQSDEERYAATSGSSTFLLALSTD